MKIIEILEGTRCWKGYKKKGMKKMFGKSVPNCVKNESASAGATASGNIATVNAPVQARQKLKRDKNGLPVAPQAKNPDGTAKNALDVKSNIMGTPMARR
tara:strand:+ start:535 stop:834 length:300 start_codon:yes stop_codon:yes gene_type:complete